MAGKTVGLPIITQTGEESDDLSQHDNPIQSTNSLESEFKSTLSTYIT